MTGARIAWARGQAVVTPTDALVAEWMTTPTTLQALAAKYDVSIEDARDAIEREAARMRDEQVLVVGSD